MVGLAELARAGTALDERVIDHLHRLVASWAPLADLSFGDLLLYAPCTGGFDPASVGVSEDREPGEAAASGDGDFVVLAHARASTGPTVHAVDPVGTVVRAASCGWLRTAMATGEPGEGEIAEAGAHSVVGDDTVVEEAGSLPLRDRRRVVDYVPVRCGDAPVAVLSREAAPAPIRHENPLETIYRGLVRPLRPDDLGRGLPLRPRREGGGVPRAAGRRRRHGARPGGPDHLRVAQRPQRAAPAGRDAPGAGLPPRRSGTRRHRHPALVLAAALHGGRVHGRDRDRGGAAGLPAGGRGPDQRSGGAAARRVGTAPPRPPAAVEGRHDPRDPPPGEEQPPDGQLAPSAPGPPARQHRGQGRGGELGAADLVHRHGARAPVARHHLRP